MAKKDKNTIDLPEVSDIPGQEHIRAPRLGELADSTASSADEEGDDILGDGDDDLHLDGRSNVSKEERTMLSSIDRRRDDSEDASLRTGLLDSTDEDGAPLNEKSFGNERNDDLSADDLDVPRESDDDIDEDEENEDYSLSDNNDDDDREINPDL